MKTTCSAADLILGIVMAFSKMNDVTEDNKGNLDF